MKQSLKKLLCLILAIASLCGVFALPASAASYTTDYTLYPEPNSSDYAYWSGSRVVKASCTTKDEIRWMQAAINHLISEHHLFSSPLLETDGSFGPLCQEATRKLQAALSIEIDGSFGPATIAAVKRALGDGHKGSQTVYALYWPTNTKTITGKYGTNGSLRSNGTRYHSGVDIGASVGSPVYAAADGVVVMCKTSDDAPTTVGGRGRYIVIYHSNGDFSSLYEHLSSCSVKVGDKVYAGQTIGKTGNSGYQANYVHYDAHLHFGLMHGKMTDTGYDLWYTSGSRVNHTFDPDPRYSSSVRYTYK